MSRKREEIEGNILIGPIEKKIKHHPDEATLNRPKQMVPFWKQNEEEAPKEKQVSEAELQLKDMVKKQLETKITLGSELAKKKHFQQASVYKDDQELRSGAQSLALFKKNSILEQELEEMRSCGMTDQEIARRNSQQIAGFGSSELASSRREKEIDEKITSRTQNLKDIARYSNAKEMTRLEIEIEQSLYRGTKRADELRHLFKERKQEYPENDPVMKTLKEYEEREARKWRTKSKLAKAEHLANGSKVMNVGGDDGDDDEDAGNGKFVGPVLAPLHVRVKPVDAREVSLHKLTIEEIMSIRKFSNYEVGAPSKKLYLKNLASNITKEDLASVFARFETVDSPCMEYKVLHGKMRGQAFISFKDEETASEALSFANGYILKDKPVIISFGREGRTS